MVIRPLLLKPDLGWRVPQELDHALEVLDLIPRMSQALVAGRAGKAAPAALAALLDEVTTRLGDLVVMLDSEGLGLAICPAAHEAHAALEFLDRPILLQRHVMLGLEVVLASCQSLLSSAVQFRLRPAAPRRSLAACSIGARRARGRSGG